MSVSGRAGSPCRPPGGTRGLVDLVGHRVRLVGEQAAPGRPVDVAAARSPRRRAGLPATAVLPRRVDRTDPGDAEAGVAPVRCTGLAARLPEPDDTVVDAPEHLVHRVLHRVRAGSTGLLGGAAPEGLEPGLDEVDVGAGRDPQPARRGAGSTRSTSSKSRVRSWTPTGAPGQPASPPPAAATAGSAPLTPPRSSPRSCSARASATRGVVRHRQHVRAGTARTAPSHRDPDDLAPARRGRPPTSSTARRRRARARASRAVTVATTVAATGSAARWSSAAAGTRRGRRGTRCVEPMAEVSQSGAAPHNWFLPRERPRPRISDMTETQSQATDTTSADPRRRRTGQAGAGGSRGELVRALEGRRHLRLRPHPAARERLLDRHPAADRQRLPARRPRLLLHAHRPDRPLPADARQVGLLPDGLGRQRPADRAPGAELLRRPLRPVAAVRRRLHPAGEARPEAAGPDQPAQLHRALRAARRAGREGLRVAVAHARPLGRLDAALHDDRRRSRRRSASARSCATSPAARPTSRRRRRSGTSRSRPRSRRPSSRPASTPAPTTGSPSTGPTASPSTSRPPAPS